MEALEIVGLACVAVGTLIVVGWHLSRMFARNDDVTHGGGYESSPVDPPASAD